MKQNNKNNFNIDIMETLTISAKYQNGKLIPFEPLPKGTDYDAIIILLHPTKKLNQKGLLKVIPVSLGKIKTDISRKQIYHE